MSMDTTVFTDATFITLDSAKPQVEALLVEGERIAFAGSRLEALHRAGPGARVESLGGRTVIPGFNDNHVHAVFAGDHALAPDLGGLSAEAIVEVLKERYPSPARGIVIRAFNWDYAACPEPSKEILDKAFPDNPVVLGQFSGHAQWLNRAALTILGIDRTSPDPQRGQILRRPDGEPTGIVRDLGETRISRLRVRQNYYAPRERERRLDLALGLFARHGITSVQDNTWYAPLVASLATRVQQGRLGTRFSLWALGRLPGSAPSLRRAIKKHAPGCQDWIRSGPVKYFVDGAFSTRTACLGEAWADIVGDACPLFIDPREALIRTARSRNQAAFHIIGDRGIERFLDIAEDIWKRYPSMKDRRIRIEHAQLIRPADIERIRDLGILIAAQPIALVDPSKDERLLGKERALSAYPYRALLDAGVNLSFGSDIPGESGCNPLQGIHLATTREGPQRISVLEALRCYTEGSAFAEGMEAQKGMLKAGMLADFTLLSEDILAVDPSRIAGIQVLRTVTGGRSVYSYSQTSDS